MRTVESKFLSEKHAKKGVEYVRVLGIKWQWNILYFLSINIV